MTGPAAVNSIDVLQEWHSALCVFRTEAMEALASVALEIQRADMWLDEQLRAWQREARDAEEEVTRYKAELSNRQTPDYSGRIPDCSEQEKNLRWAKHRLENARDQIEVVRRWYTRMPKLIEEAYSGPAHHLANFLDGDLPRSLALLKDQIRSLDAYVNLRSDHIAAPPPAQPRKEST